MDSTTLSPKLVQDLQENLGLFETENKRVSAKITLLRNKGAKDALLNRIPFAMESALLLKLKDYKEMKNELVLNRSDFVAFVKALDLNKDDLIADDEIYFHAVSNACFWIYKNHKFNYKFNIEEQTLEVVARPIPRRDHRVILKINLNTEETPFMLETELDNGMIINSICLTCRPTPASGPNFKEEVLFSFRENMKGNEVLALSKQAIEIYSQ